jgi:hypothetical protein
MEGPTRHFKPPWTLIRENSEWWRPVDGGGGRIACDRKEEECASTCGHQLTNGATRPEEGRVGAGGMEEAGTGAGRVTARTYRV